MAQIRVDPLSVVPLHLELFKGGTLKGGGTGFLVGPEAAPVLVTNRHVLAGAKSEVFDFPDEVRIWHHAVQGLGNWASKPEPLVANGTPRWKTLAGNPAPDIAALKLTNLSGVKVYGLDLALAKVDLIVQPSEPVSIIGFPFGASTVGKFPIWKTGHIASDTDLEYDGQPMFLIDATTRSGMSGSPVVAKRSGMYQTSEAMNMGGAATRFMGIYSGRLQLRNADATDMVELGTVWKPSVLEALLKTL